MATIKPRINITLSRENKEFLSVLAERDQVPTATKAAELLRTALELEEDIVLDELSSKRDTNKATFVSHEEAWK